MKKKKGHRTLIQAVAAVVQNGYIAGFVGDKIKIYRGALKNICLPGLNCYSCPGALASCPIGSLQAVSGGRKFNISFYVLGLMALFGMLLGRAVCGFLCFFGFIQDLLYKIPTPKLKVPEKLDKSLRYLKYLVMAVLVLLLPAVLTNTFGLAPPYFCKGLCPAGTLEGGVPLVLGDPQLRGQIGFLFYWKFSILIVIILSSVFIHRPFCKYLCPLGAFYSLFNKVGLWRMSLNKQKCVDCGACEKVCGMNVKCRQDINDKECIRCGSCKSVCPTKAITTQYGFRDTGIKLEKTVLKQDKI